MADEQTAVAALKAGEIDFYEIPPIDLLDQLESDKNVKLEVLNKGGNVGMCRLNWLHPPFDKVEARQAMLYLIKQEDILKAVFGNPKYYRSCSSLFGCTGQMQSEVNTDWFKGGQNIAKAKELFKKSGYDGRPVVILQATNISFMNNAALLIAQWLKEAGVNAELAASDWGAVVTRRSVKKPVAEGGWNIFITWGSGEGFDNPIGFVAHTANGDDGWFGWPKDDLHEKLRDDWAARCHARGTPGGRAQAAGECLELCANGAARPVGTAGRAPRQSQRVHPTAGPCALLERGEDLQTRARLAERR